MIIHNLRFSEVLLGGDSILKTENKLYNITAIILSKIQRNLHFDNYNILNSLYCDPELLINKTEIKL